MLPRFDGIFVKPTPHGAPADGSDQARLLLIAHMEPFDDRLNGATP